MNLTLKKVCLSLALLSTSFTAFSSGSDDWEDGLTETGTYAKQYWDNDWESYLSQFETPSSSMKTNDIDFFLESDDLNDTEDLHDTDNQPDKIDFNNKSYAVLKRLGEGREGIAWLVRSPDDNQTYVLKQFKSKSHFSKNFAHLRKLSRFLKYEHAEVVKVVSMDGSCDSLLLSFASGIIGANLYKEESATYYDHTDTHEFARKFMKLNSIVEEHPKLGWSLTTLNVIWNPHTKKIIVFDPF